MPVIFKNDIRVFYKRRLSRLIPLYWITVSCCHILQYILRGIWPTATEVTCDLLTLSYWNIGGNSGNWFIAAILKLYIAFPILYYLTKKAPNILQIALCIFIVLLYYNNGREWVDSIWKYDCFLSRLPIFVFGIQLYLSKGSKSIVYPSLLALLLTFNMTLTYNLSIFLLTSTICPFIIFGILQILTWNNSIIDSIQKFMQFCGKYSFALYTSNTVVATLILYYCSNYKDYCMKPYMTVPVYITLTIIVAYIFIFVQNICDSIFLNRKK